MLGHHRAFARGERARLLEDRGRHADLSDGTKPLRQGVRFVCHTVSHTPYMRAPFPLLHGSHRNSRFRAVLDPPRLTGTMWSNSSRARDPHSTQVPRSRLHTSCRTRSGIGSRLGLWAPPGDDARERQASTTAAATTKPTAAPPPACKAYGSAADHAVPPAPGPSTVTSPTAAPAAASTCVICLTGRRLTARPDRLHGGLRHRPGAEPPASASPFAPRPRGASARALRSASRPRSPRARSRSSGPP
jgi:hypothetical protein